MAFPCVGPLRRYGAIPSDGAKLLPQSRMSVKKSKRDRRLSNGLVALSSTAVMAVYAVGYLRTQSAADRFAKEEMARQAAVPLAPSVPEAPIQPEPATNPVLSVSVTVPPVPPVERIEVKPPEPVPVPVPVAAPEVPSNALVQPVTVVATPAKESPALPSLIAPTNAAAAPAPTAPVAAVRKWKDGIYIGWGSCRHGDIQVGVVIKEGRIFSTQITQCLTRYDCDIIAKLTKQVVDRQSPEVDYVSGATQSTNAFYYAVVEALGKAK